MTPVAREIVKQVAERRGVSPRLIVGKCRSQRAFYARVEVAKRLGARGYTTTKIGAMLGHDHTTIVYYLGRGKKRPKPEPPEMAKPRWRKPRVRHLEWRSKPRPTNVRHYLVPYAGADMTEYHWKER